MAALWLLPESGALQAQIDELANAHGSVPFEAHLTLFSTVDIETAAIATRLPTIAAAAAPFSMTISGVAHGPEILRALYLTASPSSPARRLARGLGGDLGATPHFSLIYGRFEEPQRRAMAVAVRPPAAIQIGAIALVEPGPAGWQDVSGWHSLCRHRLGAVATSPGP